MLIKKLHYISQQTDTKSHTEAIEEACEAGVRWVQLRIKDESDENTRYIASETRKICDRFNAIFILNDYPEIAHEVAADGVHLGKTDMSPLKARELLGSTAIIGGTANTFEDVKELHDQPVNYIGLGPFRFTETKRNLSPVLGLAGYKTITDKCQVEKLTLPIIAIGGIALADIQSLQSVGIHGIAAASLINGHSKKKTLITEINNYLSHENADNRR